MTESRAELPRPATPAIPPPSQYGYPSGSLSCSPTPAMSYTTHFSARDHLR